MVLVWRGWVGWFSARVVHRKPTPTYEELKSELQPGQLYVTHTASPQQSGHVIVHFKRGDFDQPTAHGDGAKASKPAAAPPPAP
jgi:hypothetical protein